MSHRIVVVLALLLAIVAGDCSASAKAPTQVPASEIVSMMAEGHPVYYEGETIVGDLDLRALPEARAKSTLSLINCTVADASFNGLTIEKDAIFLGTTFGNASFTGTVFHQLLPSMEQSFWDLRASWILSSTKIPASMMLNFGM